MLDDRTYLHFKGMEQTQHAFADHQMAFSCGELVNYRAAMATFMRVTADLLEANVEVDYTRLMKTTALCYYDQEDNVAALILIAKDGLNYVVEFAWTHPAFRHMGLFRSLMTNLIQCGNHRGIRINPPMSDAGFNTAVAKLGFRPVSLVTEYRPFTPSAV
jgi:hypothetical protein